MTGLLERVAGAPITWGVCEVPGWGLQLAADRVLGEMASIGLRATELGPDGYLPTDPPLLRDVLARAGLRLVAGFVPLVLHRADRQGQELARATRTADLLAAGGASVLVLAAASGEGAYERSTDLDAREWQTLLEGLERATELGNERGLSVALHPHHGTIVEGQRDVERVMESSSVSLCLDTGHLCLGGSDPVELARLAPERVAHVHLKDVVRSRAARVRAQEMSYEAAVRDGLYRPLGEGDVDIVGVVGALEHSRYSGWYVLEQDTILATDPGEGGRPIQEAAASLGFLQRVARDNGIGVLA